MFIIIRALWWIFMSSPVNTCEYSLRTVQTLSVHWVKASLWIIICNEMIFYLIINFVSVWLVPGLAVALQLLHGDIEQLRREYMVLFTRGVSITRKLGFSDVIMPGRQHGLFTHNATVSNLTRMSLMRACTFEKLSKMQSPLTSVFFFDFLIDINMSLYFPSWMQ